MHASFAVLLAGGIIDLDGTALVQLILFVVGLLVLRKVLFQPMVAVFEAREAAIDGAKQEAKDMAAVAKEKSGTFEERMATVRAEAQEVRDKLRQEGVALERKVLVNVREEVARSAEAAEQDLSQQRQRLTKEMEQSVPALARDVAERVLGRSV